MMKRREAIERITLMMGGTLSTQISAGLMGQVINTGASVEVGKEQIALLAELADVIIPTTDTPGAKAAAVEKFIVRLMRDCYELPDQTTFYDGLAKIDETAHKTFEKGFLELDLAEKTEIVQQATEDNKAFFRQMRQLTTIGYFTSEIGATQALEYLPIPGKFEGDIPMKPGQKAWAL